MASLFNAFLSDNESDGGDAPVAKTKKKSTQKPKPALAKSNDATKSAPKPVTSVSHQNSKPSRKNENVIEPSPKARNLENRPRGRGRGAKHGDVDRRGKRVFDKQSGTGKDRGLKKGGGGGHNWGTQLDTHYNTNVSINETAEKAEDTENEPPVVQEETAEDAEPKEQLPETFTMEDFMKKKAEKRSGLGFEDLKAAKVEGVKEGRQYAKNETTEDVFMAMGTEKSKSKKSSKKNNEKVLVDVGFKVRDTDQERSSSFRGRGGRGRGTFRGGRGGGSFRGRSRQGRIDVDTSDQQNFPTLGA